LHITTTSLRFVVSNLPPFIFSRKMQHTAAHEAVMEQKIPEEFEESLAYTQGHSRETAQRFYVMKNMQKHATTACLAHKRLHGEFTAVDIPSPSPEEEEYLPVDDPG
jgi:hypothetical protein